jgi:quercetin dioxygenase-like cupin family protein
MSTITEPEPRLLADLDWVLAQSSAAASGALWRLEETDRQLDANLIRLPPGQSVELHREPDVDVMLLPLAGGGTLRTDSEAISLAPHALIWLPHGSRRALEAGPEGLAYLTVHRKRAGMTIKLPSDPEKLRQLEAREEAEEGGEPACLLPRVCPECGRVTP